MSPNDFSLFTYFSRRFAEHADDELLSTRNGAVWTYGDIDRTSARIASFLCAAGVRVGDRVCVQVEKSPENLCLYLACLRAGFVFHPVNPDYTAKELGSLLRDSAPAAVICDPARIAEIQPTAASGRAGIVLTLDRSGSGSLLDAAAGAAEDFETVPRDRDDMAALLYSSGTTGMPKGVVLTHSNLVSNAEALVDAWGFTAADRLLHALPFYHVHGLFVATGCVLASGASMRWLPRFDAHEVLEHLPECTVMMGVPTHYGRMLADSALSRAAVRGVRLFVSGSAPLPPEMFDEFAARTGHRLIDRYGMTETNIIASNPLRGERKPGSVGLPLRGVDVRITDDRGTVLGADEVGHVQVRGPNVFTGYWRRAEGGNDFTSDGYFRTGDLGTLDHDGYLSIVGRSKDLVITGGMNVYPREVEAIIDRLPGVHESAVIGVAHPDFGEGVVAVVVPIPGATLSEADLIAACKAQLASFKVPKRVVQIAALPRNAMGKIQKNVLRDGYRGLFVEPDQPPARPSEDV